jgi:DNA-directed RNA polymerase alpha subunit
MMSKQSLSPASSRFFPKRFMGWQSHSLSVRATSALTLAGFDNTEQVAALERSYFESFRKLGEKSLAQLADLAGWPPKRRTAVDTIAASLALGMDPEEARETATDVLTSLRKAGFLLAVSNRAVA